jgi:hypothetical protein
MRGLLNETKRWKLLWTHTRYGAHWDVGPLDIDLDVDERGTPLHGKPKGRKGILT